MGSCAQYIKKMPGNAIKAPEETENPVGLALSGGGSRAIAFHLGCLRALHQEGLLSRVDSLSTVSGGSVIGALYACHDGSFAEFESSVRSLLRKGLLWPTVKTAFSTRYGMAALLNSLGLVLASLIGLILATLLRLIKRMGLLKQIEVKPALGLRRFESRTTLVARTLDSLWFHGKTIDQVKAPLIINTCDLTHDSAFYYSPMESGSWRHGKVKNNNELVSVAVAASAAYPLALPALDKKYEFVKSNRNHISRVSLTDGGVYDNTALAPFWPNRDKTISIAVSPVKTVIACRAGYGIKRSLPRPIFLTQRLKDVYSATQNRAENASIQRLFDYRNSGLFNHVILAFLGQQDSQLENVPDDFVVRESVWNYPTDFSAMNEEMITKLSARGEQLTRVILRQHASDLPSPTSTTKTKGDAV